jgi:hypothetical protein
VRFSGRTLLHGVRCWLSASLSLSHFHVCHFLAVSCSEENIFITVTIYTYADIIINPFNSVRNNNNSNININNNNSIQFCFISMLTQQP